MIQSEVGCSESNLMNLTFDGQMDMLTCGINGAELLKAAKIVAKEYDLQVNVKGSLVSGAVTGTSFVIGGLVLTPIGLTALGGVIGSGVGAMVSYLFYRKKYRSLIEIINNLSDVERDKFLTHIKEGLKNFNLKSVMALTMLLNSKDQQFFEVMKVLMIAFVSNMNEIHLTNK